MYSDSDSDSDSDSKLDSDLDLSGTNITSSWTQGGARVLRSQMEEINKGFDGQPFNSVKILKLTSDKDLSDDTLMSDVEHMGGMWQNAELVTGCDEVKSNDLLIVVGHGVVNEKNEPLNKVQIGQENHEGDVLGEFLVREKRLQSCSNLCIVLNVCYSAGDDKASEEEYKRELLFSLSAKLFIYLSTHPEYKFPGLTVKAYWGQVSYGVGALPEGDKRKRSGSCSECLDEEKMKEIEEEKEEKKEKDKDKDKEQEDSSYGPSLGSSSE